MTGNDGSAYRPEGRIKRNDAKIIAAHTGDMAMAVSIAASAPARALRPTVMITAKGAIAKAMPKRRLAIIAAP